MASLRGIGMGIKYRWSLQHGNAALFSSRCLLHPGSPCDRHFSAAYQAQLAPCLSYNLRRRNLFLTERGERLARRRAAKMMPATLKPCGPPATGAGLKDVHSNLYTNAFLKLIVSFLCLKPLRGLLPRFVIYAAPFTQRVCMFQRFSLN